MSFRVAILTALCVLQPALASAQLIISGANDEFIEIYNNSGFDHTVSAISGTGYGIAASDGTTRCTIPNGTVIPNKGHYLCINSIAYSLGSYPAGNGTTATGDKAYNINIADNAGIALFNNNTGGGSYILANRMDAVGSTSEANTLYREGAGYPALAPLDIDYSFIRRPAGGCTGSGGGSSGNCNSTFLLSAVPGITTPDLMDSDDNAHDFIFLDTHATLTSAGQRLGAPGPENSSSPTSRAGLTLRASLLDRCQSRWSSPNIVLDLTSEPLQSSTFGTWDFRRTFTNNTGAPITRLRFRVVDITTYPSISDVADLRPRTSGDLVVSVDRPPCGSGSSSPTVRGTSLEGPPSQPNSGGFNSTLSVASVTSGTPLAAGASIDVRFLLGIEQHGVPRFCVVAETLPASSAQVLCLFGPTTQAASFSSSTAIRIPAGSTSGPAGPYPSTLTVSGFSGKIAKVTVTLRQLFHSFAGDVDVLLVGPTGVKLILMSDVGGSGDWGGATYTFDIFSPNGLPSDHVVPSGRYRPTNGGGGDTFSVPAPAGPYLSPPPDGVDTLTAFNGLTANGTWSLYIIDDQGGDTGALTGGWELALTAVSGVTSDFNGNGATEPAVYRPSTGTWFAAGQAPVQWGLPGDVIVAGDYNGDGTSDRAVYRPSNGTWYIQSQGEVQWGLPGDIPVPGDYDGEGITHPAVWRPSNGKWYLKNGNQFTFGLPGDIPVPGDYNSDGATDIAVYRPSTGTWFVLDQATTQWGLPGDIPVPGDYNGDLKKDFAVYRPSTGMWHVQGQFSMPWGLPGDIPVPGDFDGDTQADLSVYRPSNGTWYIKLSTTDYASSTTTQFGLPGDMPIPNSTIAYVVALRSTLATLSRISDFDGDRLSDLTVFRPSSATWLTLRSASDFVSSTSVQWGFTSDVAVPHDYDGDGQTDFAVYRPSTGNWHVLRSTSGYTSSTAIPWGLSGDVPMPGDYDGDGLTDLAVYRPTTGQWLILKSSTGYATNIAFQWGLAGDVPMSGDFDGDAVSDLTVYRPSNGTWWTRYSTTGHATSGSFQWGLSGDVAVPGEYDGDGVTDHAVYRPSDGTWYILHSSTNKTTNSSQQWGLNGDIPVPGEFDGDRRTDFAIWRPSNATWYFLLSSTNNTVFDQIQWGLSSDIPILKRP
jgi:subtilisin-like proprotein convertase family protein